MEQLRWERGGSGRGRGRGGERWVRRGGAYRSLEAEELSSHCGGFSADSGRRRFRSDVGCGLAWQRPND